MMEILDPRNIDCFLRVSINVPKYLHFLLPTTNRQELFRFINIKLGGIFSCMVYNIWKKKSLHTIYMIINLILRFYLYAFSENFQNIF